MKTIGFIGIGVMGKSMVRNLREKGYEVSIYTRTKEKAEELIFEGALWCDSVKECVKDKDVVITIVGYPKDVEEVYFGEAGINPRITDFFHLYRLDRKLMIKVISEYNRYPRVNPGFLERHH